MDTFADILAGARQSRAEAVAALANLNAGAPPPPAMTREQAVEILQGNIAMFDTMIKRLDWRNS